MTSLVGPIYHRFYRNRAWGNAHFSHIDIQKKKGYKMLAINLKNLENN